MQKKKKIECILLIVVFISCMSCLKEVFFICVHFQVMRVPMLNVLGKSLRCCHRSPSTGDKVMLIACTSTCAPNTAPSSIEEKTQDGDMALLFRGYL